MRQAREWYLQHCVMARPEIISRWDVCGHEAARGPISCGTCKARYECFVETILHCVVKGSQLPGDRE